MPVPIEHNIPLFKSEIGSKVFDALVDSFIEDYMVRKYVAEKSGWRTLTEIAAKSHISQSALYGRHSSLGGALDEPVRRGLIESRIFPGERGRGGEVTRLRIAYDKEPIKDYVNKKIMQGKQSAGSLADRGIASPPSPVQELGLQRVYTRGEQNNETPIKIHTGVEALDEILEGGYPGESSIMVCGPQGIGKEALGYWFLRSGLAQGDFCLYVTHKPMIDIVKNMRGFGIEADSRLEFMARSGSERRCDIGDPDSIFTGMMRAIQQNTGRKIRIATDILSPLLMLNSTDFMYGYWTHLLQEIRNFDVVFLSFVEEAMHPPNVFAAMELLFDGVIELSIYRQGLSLIPLLQIKKMLGLPPLRGYFKFAFTSAKMEITANVSK